MMKFISKGAEKIHANMREVIPKTKTTMIDIFDCTAKSSALERMKNINI